MGTLNLCLKVSEQMQKTRTQFDHPRLKKTSKIGQIRILKFFSSFGAFSQPKVILSSTLEYKFKVPTRHTLKKFVFVFLLKVDCEERHFGNASSVNFDF